VRTARRLIAVGALAAVGALGCGRTAPRASGPDASAPACASRAGDPCCAGATGGAPFCDAPGLVCAGVACTCLAQVTAVYDTTPLVRRVDGTVWVAADRARFTEILGPTGHLRATDIAASGSTAYGTATGCAIVDGGVWCFPLVAPLTDSTDLGAGLGPGVTTTGPVRVVTAADPNGPPLAGARQLSATMNGGGAAFCAVTDDGKIWCWGYGADGILGSGDALDSAFARPVLAGPTAPFSSAAEVRLGFKSACARKTDGSVWCWGDATLGELGIADSEGLDPGATVTAFYPEGPLQMEPAVRLAANPGNTHCAIHEGGRVTCWGWNAYAQVGAPPSDFALPTPIVSSEARLPLTDVVDVAPDHGMQAMCAATADGALSCWGHPFAPPGAPDLSSPLPVAIPRAGSADAPLRLPLSSYGGRDGALVYVDPNGQLTIEAGAYPFAAQPPCE
jgi:hypothetical protein